LVDVLAVRGDEKLTAALLARYGHLPHAGEHAGIIKDETRCVRCGLCAVRCPTGAITMEKVEWVAA
jgi:NAD-dependent dihydropyrimidine dehydrogenase PreA subunit